MTLPSSWRTTLFGAGGLIAVAIQCVHAWADDKPDTNPNWDALVTQGVIACGLFFARDEKSARIAHQELKEEIRQSTKPPFPL